MSLKELINRKPFTGFVAHFSNGKSVKEREFFFSKKLNKNLATNWAELDKNLLIRLDLIWNDQLKAQIDKVPTPSSFNKGKALSPGDWFFSQKGYLDMGTRKIKVISRNIGYIEDGILNIISVQEETGALQMTRRKA
jgi:hypothetical protein